ncbi:MAG TPA: serine hydrolase domain-containing protein, partial [Cellvibrionaceae bacterium]
MKHKPNNIKRSGLLLTVAVCALLGSIHAHGGGIETATPEDVGMSSERLERLSALNQRYIEQGKLAGIATMIARKGKVIYVDVIGSYGVNNPKELTRETLFRIFSMTKPITAVGLMMLYEEGAFQLSDPVSKFLPNLAQPKVWTEEGLVTAKSEITMYHLLTHTAGLSYGFSQDDPVDKLYRDASSEPAKDIDEFIDRVASLPLISEPGERWHYSIASDVLGAVVEKITGTSFAEFLQRRVFDRLAMEDTFFSVPEGKLDRLAINHSWDYESKSLKALSPESPFNDYTDVTLYLGGQGLVSTLGDYMKFAEMLRNGGQLNGVRLLSPKTIEFMTKNHLHGMQGAKANGESPTLNLPAAVGGPGFGLGFGIFASPVESGTLTSRGTYY